MKRALGVIKIIVIVAAALLLLHLLIRWKPLDDFLTSKIGGPSVRDTVSDTLIRIENVHGLLPESQKPFVYEEGGRLYVIYKGESIDITPEGVSSVFYGKESGINEKLRYRDHACFDEAGGRLLFVVDVQNVPELFLAELENAEAREEVETDSGAEQDPEGISIDPVPASSAAKLVANNVNSFFFLGGEPVYAEGYGKFNSLNIYRGGESVKLMENAVYVPVPELDGLLYVTAEGSLGFFSRSGMQTYALSENVSEVKDYCAFGDGKLLVFSVAENNYQSIVFDSQSGRAIKSVVDHVPDKCCSGGSEALTFDLSSGRIELIDAGGEKTDIFASSGRIYNMFYAKPLEGEGTENGFEVIFATKKGIFKGVCGSSGENVSRLCAFKGALSRYASNPWLISYHLNAGGDFNEGFYISALSDQSHIYNSRNPMSWLNRFSSYVYRLMYVSGGKVSACGVPLSRSTDLPETISGTAVLYTARFAGGDVKSLSVLDKGDAVCKDVLKSDGMAKGSSDIRKEIAEGKVFITAVRNPGHADEYVDYCMLEDDLGAVKATDGHYAVSFGTVVSIS